jgi:hypothetical protein
LDARRRGDSIILALYLFHILEENLGVGFESITEEEEDFVESIQATLSKETP